MSLGKKEAESSKVTWKQALLYAYILISACLIIWMIIGYFKNVVYSAGVQAGYQTAVGQLVQQIGEKCEPVAINVGETKVDVINVACLQQPEAGATDAAAQ